MQPNTLRLILVPHGEVDANRIGLEPATVSVIDRAGRKVVRPVNRHCRPGFANPRWRQDR